MARFQIKATFRGMQGQPEFTRQLADVGSRGYAFRLMTKERARYGNTIIDAWVESNGVKMQPAAPMDSDAALDAIFQPGQVDR